MIAMDEHEHCNRPDSRLTFTSSNGVTTTSAIEWEFVVCPDEAKYTRLEYPERKGFPEEHPDWCRQQRPIEEMLVLTEERANRQLRRDGHSELLPEELVAGRLYTGFAAATLTLVFPPAFD